MFCQGITYKTAKKKKGMIVGFVSFETFEHVENATQVIICPVTCLYIFFFVFLVANFIYLLMEFCSYKLGT